MDKVHLKSKNGNLWLLLLLFIALSFIEYQAFKKNAWGAFVIIALFLLFYIVGFFNLRELKWVGNEITYKSLWTKKEFWKISQTDLKTLTVQYSADERFKDKKLFFQTFDGLILEANSNNIYLKKLATPFIKNNIKVIHEQHGNWVEYQLPKNKNT